VAPYSDCYGRDMLLLELLFMDRALSPEDPPARWNGEQLQRRYAAWRARSDPLCWRTLAHLEPSTVFSLAEQQRPTSTRLAAGLGLSLPQRPLLRPAAQLGYSTSTMLGHHSVAAQVQRLNPRRKPTKVRAPRRWPTPNPAQIVARLLQRGGRRPPSQEDKVFFALLVALSFIPLLLHLFFQLLGLGGR